MRAGIVSALAAILWIPFPAPAQEGTASVTGTVIDHIGAAIAHAGVELDSGTRKYLARTDDAGVYQFSNLAAGVYALTIRVPGFKVRIVKSIGLLEQEQKQLPDVPLDVGTCGSLSRDLILLPSGAPFGSLTGGVTPPVKDVEVTLICRTFSACGSTRTDSNGRFSFDMLSASLYGLNFHHEGFYPENATGYEYTVNVGWESVYSTVRLERCFKGNCDPRLRPKRPIRVCE